MQIPSKWKHFFTDIAYPFHCSYDRRILRYILFNTNWWHLGSSTVKNSVSITSICFDDCVSQKNFLLSQINLKGIKKRKKKKRKPVIYMFRYVDSLSSLSCYIVIFKHDMHWVLILNTYENPCTILLNISSYLTHLHSSNLLISSIKYSFKIFVPTMFTNNVLLLFNLNRFLPFLCRNLTFLKLKLSFCFAPDTAIWRQ